MILIFSTVLTICSLLLVLLVLMHKGRGGGLSDMFGGGVSSSLGGSSVAERNLDRITVGIAVVRAVAASCGGTGPRQPVVGSSNLRTSRSEKGVRCIRARLTAFGERTTSIRDPGGSSVVRRPSHHSTPRASVRVSTSTAIIEFGEMTRGRENRAWALRGTMSSASTSGQTTGPPAENA